MKSKKSALGRQTQEIGTVPQRRIGWTILHEKRIEDLLAIERYYGGWPTDMQRYCLELYAVLLRCLDQPIRETITSVAAMALRCHPPYPNQDDDIPVADLVEKIYERRILMKFRNTTLLRSLYLTPELARELNLKTILPQEMMRQPKGFKRIREERQAFIHEYLQHNRQPSGRVMVQLLKDAGFRTNHQTVLEEMNRLRQGGQKSENNTEN